MQKGKIDTLFYKIYIFIAAFLGFLWLHPFFTWDNSVIPLFAIIHILLFLLWIIVSGYKINKSSIFSAFFAFVLIAMFSFKDENIIRNLWLYSFSLIPLVLIRNKERLKIYDNFIKIIAISLIPAVVIAVLLFVGLDLQWSQLSSTSWTKPYYRNYFNVSIYHFFNGSDQRYFLPWGGSIDRICGMFDEPGVIGTITGLILVSKGFSLRRGYEKILCVAGICSFSFAFYVIVFVYILVKKYKYALVSIGVLLILINTVPKDTYVYEKVLYRFELGNNQLEGNNRANAGFEQIYKGFLQDGNLLLGMKEKEYFYKANAYGSEALSWKTFVVVNGFLLFVLHTIYFTGYAFTMRNRYVWIFCIIYFLSIYQRPYDFSLSYWLVFLGGLAAFDKMSKSNFSKKIRANTNNPNTSINQLE
ncbi:MULTISPECIES: transcriptional regulator [Bacillus cereus group]|uniref:transcriptional regulator n=1 Tax=Bacillus cereus group TaxID=86661 RepID=UPI000B4438DC|nr:MULTISPECIES: transcriptional regulator [Bacillus cereus group]MEB9736624.1 transcriptional regulator [Bacillus cereus]OTW79130.1 transcriptional regulator [Bacillus thuringiensis serovar jinghongiensis]OTX16745.1 transcriptional regulator [Bacillus thuringiensis serovar japonensis]PFC53964.1 transcriptional regulator [Bacillus cereus]PFJ94117.1 transcriptional regulator [Bacillus cereus]